jgi:hypothetical protein
VSLSGNESRCRRRRVREEVALVPQWWLAVRTRDIQPAVPSRFGGDVHGRSCIQIDGGSSRRICGGLDKNQAAPDTELTFTQCRLRPLLDVGLLVRRLALAAIAFPAKEV